MLDVLATRSENELFLHLIKREKDEPMEILVNLPEFEVERTATFRSQSGPVFPQGTSMISESQRKVKLKKDQLSLTVPPDPYRW